MKIGILALQGDYEAHRERLVELGASALLVRRVEELEAVGGLILPGGESSTMLKLLDQPLREALVERIGSGLPVLATCAGTILLADRVTNPAQSSLQLLDMDVERNGYGRQADSFIDDQMTWTDKGRELIKKVVRDPEQNLEGVFIRAPKITRLGPDITVLACQSGDAVLVRKDSIIAATFHPELTPTYQRVHQLFLSLL